MSKSIEAIRRIAKEIRAEKHNGWGSELSDIADELDAARSRASEVEAQTIERCAKECDEMARQFLPANFDHSDDAEECRRIRQMALSLAAAIRSMRPTGDSGVQS